MLTTTGVNGSPTLTKRELSTVVGVNPDDVVILGGLDEDKSSSDRSGLAWLPWFKADGKATSKTEIMLMLQAQKI